MRRRSTCFANSNSNGRGAGKKVDKTNTKKKIQNKGIEIDHGGCSCSQTKNGNHNVPKCSVKMTLRREIQKKAGYSLSSLEPSQ